MFLKQEKPDLDDFERRKKCHSNGKIHILLFQNILSIFFYFEKKTLIFEGRSTPSHPLHPLRTRPQRMQFFWTCSLSNRQCEYSPNITIYFFV